VLGVAFSPDGRSLASASYDQTARIWDARTGETRLVLAGHTQRIYAIAFTPDGRRVATGSADGSVRVWNAESGALERRLEHGAAIYGLAIAPDGRLAVSVGTDNLGRVWDLGSGAELRELRGHTDRVFGVAFAPDGRLVATGSYDGTIRLWDPRSGATVRVLRGHTDSVDGLQFTRDGRTLLSASEDRSLRAWNLATGESRVVGVHPARLYKVAIHPDGRSVGASGADGTARLWDLERGTYRVLARHFGEVNEIVFSPDGALAATASDDGTIRLWETATGRLGWRAPALVADTAEALTHTGWRKLPGGAASGGIGPVCRARVESDARFLSRAGGDAACLETEDGQVELWSVGADRRIAATAPPGGHATAVEATADACLILAEQTVRLLEAGGERTLASRATAVAWARDRILVADGDQVLVLDSAGRLARALPGGRDITALGPVGDGDVLLGFANGNLEIVPLSAERSRHAFEGTPATAVVRIVPGPAGTSIAAFANGFVGLWNPANGALLAWLRLHGAIAHLARAGRWLLVASDLGDVTSFDLGPFDAGYCDLMAEIWAEVPVAWEGGLAVAKPAPGRGEHACR